MKLLVLALIATMILVLPITHAYGTPKLTSWRDKGEKYKQYEIDLHIKVNGKSIPMVLDTGSSVTGIPLKYAKELHLNKVHNHSGLLKNTLGEYGVVGPEMKEKAKDVTMSIEGSKPFKTAITYDPSNTDQSALLSIHDFIKAFSGLQFKPTLQFIH